MMLETIIKIIVTMTTGVTFSMIVTLLMLLGHPILHNFLDSKFPIDRAQTSH